MTKNLTKIFMSAALFAGIATADTDLFAKLSNGAMSDKDAGIVELSREQKAKVVGGYYVHGAFVLQNMQLGWGTSLLEIAAVAELTPYESSARVVCGAGYTINCASGSYANQQRYNELVSIANPDRGEFLAITATKTTRTMSYGAIGSASIPQYTFGAAVVGINRNGSLYKIRSTNVNSYVASEMMRLHKNDLSRILAAQL
ncbi:MAG: hypothetical protein K2O85_03605 [Helicobacter sp.]|nr:hypothetical protein [Helicobacter sp.]